jgi:aminoglycoside phosphotransferase (APT) family kinase protein
MIYADDGPEVVGLLDWELCAIGAPSTAAFAASHLCADDDLRRPILAYQAAR